MVLDQTSIEILVFIGASLGIAGRTILPYFKARTESDEKLKFEAKYVFAAAYAAVISIASGLFLWPQIIVAVNPAMSIFSVFVLSFTMGWASNDIINTIQSSLRPSEVQARAAIKAG